MQELDDIYKQQNVKLSKTTSFGVDNLTKATVSALVR